MQNVLKKVYDFIYNININEQEMRKDKTTMEELNLKELFNIFWNKKAQIILITLIFMVIGAIYSYLYVKPDYSSYTSLVLAKSSDTEESKKATTTDTITTSDLTLNSKLVSTYNELIKSKKVLKKVINNLNLSETEDQLKKGITVSAVTNTEVIKISVTNSIPEKAKKIANEIAKVFTEEVSEIYSINNVYVVDEAEIAKAPYNINHIKDILMFALVGLVISIGYALVLNMLDTTIKSEEDVEKKLDLPVLTVIPICNFDETPAVRGKK